MCAHQETSPWLPQAPLSSALGPPALLPATHAFPNPLSSPGPLLTQGKIDAVPSADDVEALFVLFIT